MAIANETKTIVGVFNSVSDAQRAVQDLEMEGIPRADISLVANKNAVDYDQLEPQGKGSDIAADAGIGAAIGGVGGLLLSAAGALTIPVIGPILAAGPIAAALTGAGIGAAAGGLIGALTESGIPEEDARYYAEGVRRGDVLVTVKTDSVHSSRVSDILDQNGAIDIDDRISGWRSRGWSGYDQNAQPYTADELRRERSLINSGTTVGTAGMASSIGAPTRGNTGVNTTEDINRAHDRRFSDTDGDGTSADSLASTNYGAGRGRVADIGNAVEHRMDRAGDKMEAGTRNTAQKLEHGMERLGDKIENAWDRVTGEAREAGREVRDEVRETRDDMRDEQERRRRARVYDYRG